MMESNSRSAAAITALLSMHHHSINPGHDIPEPLDCSPPALDLSRKRPISPDYPYNYPVSKRLPLFVEFPSSTICSTSPKSQSDGSDTSEFSASSDPMRDFPSYPITPRLKPTRPFKAYPKDPMSLSIGVVKPETLMGKDSVEAYSEFRHKMLSQVQANHNGTNKNMRRNSQNSQNAQNSDPTYWEKRKKNNEAAKRSRDARRAKEDEIAIRCAFLEQENMQLKFRVAALESERERLQGLAYH